MTFREKLALEHPEAIAESCQGGCIGCPSSYGYEENLEECEESSEKKCTRCWDREIPETMVTVGEDIPADGSYVEILGHRITGDFKTFEEFYNYLKNLEEHSRQYKKLMAERAETDIKPVELSLAPSQTGVGMGKIKDSGDRTEFATGAVRDMREGKGRMDLLPWSAIMEVSKHCENGAKKYGEHNVDKGIPTSSLCDSAARHLAKYLEGWTDEPHLVAAAWNLLWAIQMTIKNKEVVNTPWMMIGATTTNTLQE